MNYKYKIMFKLWVWVGEVDSSSQLQLGQEARKYKRTQEPDLHKILPGTDCSESL